MKLTDQVVGLNQATRLKLLDVIQKSLFYHHPNFNEPVAGNKWTTKAGKKYEKTMVCNDKKGAASAFTVAELGIMLPTAFDTMRITGKTPDESVWQGYDHDGNDFARVPFNTEAEARAAMLIHLLQNKLITADEVNKRLTCS